jgi:hypothetical protein
LYETDQFYKEMDSVYFYEIMIGEEEKKALEKVAEFVKSCFDDFDLSEDRKDALHEIIEVNNLNQPSSRL